ncbi:MAG: dihydroneopterin aldolase [Verrucomicrobiota bacterium]|mgnify:CR=1 FL=1|nr:dihydroneopterin aldolase [Verrucomicrobiota bacterium]
MSDLIILKDIEVSAHIGVPDEERQNAQRLAISLCLKTSLKRAGKSDRIEDTINYHDIYKLVQSLAQEKPRKLIETLAEEIAEAILSQYKVKSVEVLVKKFIFPDTAFIAVQIKRKDH